jgi:hypothetical protein
LQSTVLKALAKMTPEEMDLLLLKAHEAYDSHGEGSK